MRKIAICLGTASYIVLNLPSVPLSGKDGDFGLMWISFMALALIVSAVLSGVAFSVARDSHLDIKHPRSVLHRFELVILGFPAFATVALGAIAVLGMLAMLGMRLAS